MPKIGSITFSLSENFKAGAAFRLARPSKRSISFSYSDHQILIGPSTPFVVIQSPSHLSDRESFDHIRGLLEDALDMLSMQGNGDFSTVDTGSEHFAWGYSDNPRQVELTDSLVLPMKASGVGVAPSPDGRPQQRVVPIPRHHVGFRYFRHSQITDDLFDAYRNMFLAFESLLSTQVPKNQGESEGGWLRRALEGVSSELDLAKLVSTNSGDAVGEIIDIAYKQTRCSLFHAKNGQPTYLPLSRPEDRESTIVALQMLSQLVLRMGKVWYDTPRHSSWFNPSIAKEMFESAFGETTIAISNGREIDCNDSLENLINSSDVLCSDQNNRIVGCDSKPNLVGSISSTLIKQSKEFSSLCVVKKDKLLYVRDFETLINLNDTDGFNVKMTLQIASADQPKSRFMR